MKGFLLRRPLTDGQKDAFVKAGGERGAQIAKKLQQGLPAIALSAHPALVTAFMNDVDPDLIYAQQVIGYGRPGDLLIGVSTSGNAKNVAAAVIAARRGRGDARAFRTRRRRIGAAVRRVPGDAGA